MNQSLKDFIYSSRSLAITAQFQQVSYADFWQDVKTQAQALVSTTETTWALWESDSYEFLVLLFAAWFAKKRVVLPPNRIVSIEQSLAAEHISFLSRQHVLNNSTAFELKFNDDFLNQAQVDFYTSGSTGEPKRIERTLKQLLLEVQGLEQTFHLPQDCVILATVSHQHIYGLLFKLLWSLYSGRCFYSPQLLFPEDVIIVQQKLAQQNCVVSSPALLKRWAKDLPLQHCINVFSSGGKLESGIRPQLNQTVTEILGSSETGGIAYRDHDDAYWQAFDDVEVLIEQQCLKVRTAHAYSSDWIETGDRAEWHNIENSHSMFKLLGRADRIIKLEEKRLSLDAIEQQILSLSQVSQCRALLTEHQQRQMLACVVVLNAEARQQLKSIGKRQFVAELKQQLHDKLEPIAIPRLWRFLTELPQNSQSKFDHATLLQLFQPMLQPVVLAHIANEQQHEWRLEFTPELECFKGHFPNQPIYPGVGQIGFIQKFALQFWTDLLWCNGYEQLKFQQVIKPYTVVTLKLTRKQHKVSFELVQNDQTMASGRLLFSVV